MTHGALLQVSGLADFDSMNVLTDNKNVYFETSGIAATGKDSFIETAVKTVGVERVISGSNSPRMNLGLEIERVKVAAITEEQKQQIFGKNLAKLLGLNI